MDAPAFLAEIVDSKGWPSSPSLEQLDELGRILAETIGREKPWGRSYMSNVLMRRVDPSAQLCRAIQVYGALLDGAPLELARLHPVQVLAVEGVEPGSILTIQSRRCAYVKCRKPFIPSCAAQRYHSPECRRLAARLRRGSFFEGG
jgi:hypothetical protein